MYDSLRSDVKDLAEKEFKETGVKKLFGGIGIRELTKMEYDSDEALKWAKSHSLCLKLDDKSFKQIAKTQEIDFVKTTKEVIVTFPKEIVVDMGDIA